MSELNDKKKNEADEAKETVDGIAEFLEANSDDPDDINDTDEERDEKLEDDEKEVETEIKKKEEADDKTKEKEDEEKKDETEEEEEEEEEDGKDEKDEYISRLQADLLGRELAPDIKKKPESKEKEEEDDKKKIAAKLIEFIPKDKYEEIMKSPEKFNEFLNAFHDKISESYLTATPEIFERLMAQANTYREAGSSFYKKSSDLLPHHEYVTFVAKKVRAEHPDWETGKILGEIETRARDGLGITKPKGGAAEDDDKRGAPGFAPGTKGKKRTRKKPKVSGMEQEISEMIDENKRG